MGSWQAEQRAPLPSQLISLQSKGTLSWEVGVDLLQWTPTASCPDTCCSVFFFLFSFFSRDTSHKLVHAILPFSKTPCDLMLGPEPPLSRGPQRVPSLVTTQPPPPMLYSVASVTSSWTILGRCLNLHNGMGNRRNMYLYPRENEVKKTNRKLLNKGLLDHHPSPQGFQSSWREE